MWYLIGWLVLGFLSALAGEISIQYYLKKDKIIKKIKLKEIFRIDSKNSFLYWYFLILGGVFSFIVTVIGISVEPSNRKYIKTN